MRKILKIMSDNPEWTEDSIEEFIKVNKDKFEVMPRPEMENSFLKKFKKIIVSIIPHLIWVGIFVVIIWAVSFSLWYFFELPTLWGLFWNWIR